ncbi:BOS complex subunit NOMO3 [Planococcus citri]|uniref:BOS complex subunit NOMO3 n=1 Tax=Planococcus citri TaxID=170843 RepID=UPI0031FA1721
MKFLSVYWIHIIVSVCCFEKSHQSDRILGCNGFIKSDVPIDLSKVEVKLFSKEGNLKDRIECAPNNGYFFLPIYDKGEYVLKPSSIHKWVFEPASVKINFDGQNDICSKGQDVHFLFKGFRVYGKVASIGDRKGPKGITITLVADLPTEQKEVHSVVTEENGTFDISPVLPGSYIIRSSHPSWRLSKSLTTFNIERSNHELPPRSLIFAGYDVSGSVVSSGEPIAGVDFILFNSADTTVDKSWILGCDTTPVEGFNSSDLKLTNVNELCHVKSNSKGQFIFPSVPSGNYVLVPFYKTVNSLKFDVHPRNVRFTVAEDSHVFSKPFQVSGFSIIGRVLSHPENGKPMPKAKVMLDKDKLTETDDSGTFIFEGVKSGSHSIQVKTNDYLFEDLQLKISPNSATLENIYPAAFKVCGKVTKLQQVDVQVNFVSASGNKPVTDINKNGEFCTYLSSGDYSVKVSFSGKDSHKILWFYPETLNLKIKDKPVNNVNFEQKTASLGGSVICDDDNSCDETNLLLLSIDGNNIEKRTTTKNGKYIFTELHPGKYELSVLNNDEWCWELKTLTVGIAEIVNTAPPFRRIGISFTVSSSHNTKLRYMKLSKNDTVVKEGILDIQAGIQDNCLPGDAVYDLEPLGCHGYSESIIRWEIGQDSLMLTALTHQVTGYIVSSEKLDDIYVKVLSDYNSTLKAKIGPIKPIADKNKPNEFVYKYQFQATPDLQLTIQPESSALLFTPSHLSILGPSDCVELEERIVAKRGIRLAGRVDPPLKDVRISILDESDEIIVSMFTDQEGKYKFMPLHSDHRYRVIGEKEGYILTGPLENGVFKAHKLADVQVTLVDDDNKPLQGVLLSLSGGENYRQTSQSNVNGKITFLSLKPSEYYLRPMLKEYKFSPPSKVVKIKEGESVPVTFKGHRVLYSAFGNVASLNRISENNVVLEAVGKPEGECVQHQEEGTTDESGNYRIRGLQPDCNYDIRLKKGPNVNKSVFKTLPETAQIKVNATDVENINFITVLEPTQCDVWVFVSVQQSAHVRTLQLKLIDEEGNIMHTVKLNEWKLSKYQLKTVVVTFPTLSLNNKNYYVQLDSTLPKSMYTYSSNVVQFTTNATYHGLRMDFKTELNVPDGEVKHSYSAAVFIVLVALIYWFREQVLQTLSQLPNNYRCTMPEFLNKYTQPPKPKETESPFELEPSLTIVKRKLRPSKKI